MTDELARVKRIGATPENVEFTLVVACALDEGANRLAALRAQNAELLTALRAIAAGKAAEDASQPSRHTAGLDPQVRELRTDAHRAGNRDVRPLYFWGCGNVRR